MTKIHLRTESNGARCQRDLGIPSHLQATITTTPNPDKVTCQPCHLLAVEDAKVMA